jgi:hypothetical protein
MEKSLPLQTGLPSASLPSVNSLTRSTTEAKQAPTVKAEAPAKATASPRTARARGEAMGAAFATLNSQDFDRASDMRSAVDAGFHNAARRDEYERDCAENPEMLRDMGFFGRSEED